MTYYNIVYRPAQHTARDRDQLMHLRTQQRERAEKSGLRDETSRFNPELAKIQIKKSG